MNSEPLGISVFEGWPIAATIGGVTVGALGTYIVTRILDSGRRRNEAKDISRSLYSEIADRAARSLNDYLQPWRSIGTSSDSITIERVGKFRPVNAIVYPGVAAKLGLLAPTALFLIMQFYFRLDAIRREIDDLARDYGPKDDLRTIAPSELNLCLCVFRRVLAPA
jgi:hypothetical protein